MSKTNETTSNTTGSLFRVNYSYVANNGALRGGAIVIEAKDTTEAQKIADDRLATFGLKHYRITSAKQY